MARSVWKGPFVDLHLLKKAEAQQDAGTRAAPIKTWSRRSTILPQFVGLTFNVYNMRDGSLFEDEIRAQLDVLFNVRPSNK